MAAFKLTFLLTTLSLLSCKANNKDVIVKWGNGKPKIERVYSDTQNCFVERNYYENGRLASETKFIDSTKNGESVAYYKDGKLLGKCIYKNGIVNGEVTEYHRNGSLMFKGNQIDGNLLGRAMHYYDNGKPEAEHYYTEGKVFLANYWDSSGMQQIIYGNGIKKFQDYLNRDKNGNNTTINVFVVGIYKDSLPNGHWKYYKVVDNKLVLERDFEDGRIISEIWK